MTLSDARAADQLSFVGGTLNGAGTLTLGGQFAWSSGSLSRTGVLNANSGLALTGDVDLRAGHTLNLSGVSSGVPARFITARAESSINDPRPSFGIVRTCITTGGGSEPRQAKW